MLCAPALALLAVGFLWPLLVLARMSLNRTEEALAVLKHCRELAPGEKQIQLAEARTDGLLRNRDAALALMLDLKHKYPDYKELYPELARLQQGMEKRLGQPILVINRGGASTTNETSWRCIDPTSST